MPPTPAESFHIFMTFNIIPSIYPEPVGDSWYQQRHTADVLEWQHAHRYACTWLQQASLWNILCVAMKKSWNINWLQYTTLEHTEFYGLIKIKQVNSNTVLLHILQRVNSWREDEEHGCRRARLFKRDREVQWSANHVLAPKFLLYKVSAGRIWLTSVQRFLLSLTMLHNLKSSIPQCAALTAAYKKHINLHTT